jgi:hypothetical protein
MKHKAFYSRVGDLCPHEQAVFNYPRFEEDLSDWIYYKQVYLQQRGGSSCSPIAILCATCVSLCQMIYNYMHLLDGTHVAHTLHSSGFISAVHKAQGDTLHRVVASFLKQACVPSRKDFFTV